MTLGIDLSREQRIAPTHPIDDRLTERGNAPNRRVSPELGEVVLEHRPEERRHQPLRLSQRRVDGLSAGLDPP